MTKWLNNICPENQVAEYMKETMIWRAQWTRQNGAKTVEIVREYPRLLDTPGHGGLHFFTKTDLNFILFAVIN
jgi:hypothetical protein